MANLKLLRVGSMRFLFGAGGWAWAYRLWVSRANALLFLWLLGGPRSSAPPLQCVLPRVFRLPSYAQPLSVVVPVWRRSAPGRCTSRRLKSSTGLV